MTMVRTVILSGKGVQYTPSTIANAKSVVIILHDSPQMGTDLTLIDAVRFISRLKNGIDNPNRIVIIPQLQTGQTGFWANTIQPVLDYIIATYPTLPIDWAGFGMGAANLVTAVPIYVTKIRSAAIVSTTIDQSTTTKTALAKVYSFFAVNGDSPSIAQYPNDKTSMDNVFNAIRASGVPSIIASENWQSSPPDNLHNAWDQFFCGIWYDGSQPTYNFTAAGSYYWSWLDSIVDADPGALRTTTTTTAAPKRIYVNGINVGPWNGAPIVKVEMV